jgi:hypothetical protein
MPRWLKWTLRITIGIFVLVTLLWLGIAAYVQTNKKFVLKEITEQLNENICGKLSIGSMEPTLVRGFPGVSIELKNVLLRDSLWNIHHRDLLKAKQVYVSVNAFSIIRGKPRIRDISIENGSVYLFTDSTGYSNTNIFKRREDRKPKEKQGQPRITKFYFKNIEFAFENDTKFKLFQVGVRKLTGNFNYKVAGWELDADVDALIKNFAFNVAAGSFLKNKRLAANFQFSYDKNSEVVTLPVQPINIDEDKLNLGAKFFLKNKPSSFDITVQSDGILYKNAVALVTPKIAKKLLLMDLQKPLKLNADIEGKMKFRDTPRVRVSWEVTDNTFTVPGAVVEHVSFTGNYTNEVDAAMGHNDRNSRVQAFGMKGQYKDIPFTADTVQVTNIIMPVFEGRFKSKFPLEKLGPALEAESFAFNGGQADLNLIYRGALNPENDTIQPFINGYVQIKDANITYAPRGLNFKNTNLTLLFRGQDLFINDVKLQSGTTSLYMNGKLLNFLNLYYTDPEKIVLDWNIKSPQINLNEFRGLLGRRTVSRRATTSGKANISRLSRQLDAVLEQSSVHMLLHVDKVMYRKFFASNINADVTMAGNGISLKNVSVNHADGRILLNASMNQGGSSNHLDLDATIENVHINEFIDAFENFGQTTLNAKNIKGRFFAKAKVSGNVKDNGDLVPRSLHGTVDFNLKDGQLINFEPLVKVGKFIFRKRKLENITFSDLKNRLEVKGDKIYINPMLIESSALNAKIEGVYALGPGTDISMDIPLRNPQKDELILDDSLKAERQMKGLVLHLRAVDGEDGSVKIKWNRKEAETLEAGEKQERQEKKKNRLFRRRSKE